MEVVYISRIYNKTHNRKDIHEISLKTNNADRILILSTHIGGFVERTEK